MGTLYLVNLFDDQINDVLYSSGDELPITGSYVLRVPDDVTVRSPVDAADILTQKYASILAHTGLFGQVLYDDMLDATGINLVTSTGLSHGDKGMVSLYDSGVLTSTSSSFVWAGAGAGPTNVLMTWEIFQYVDVDDANAPYVRNYKEISTSPATSPITVEVSFNNGGNWYPVIDKILTTIPTLSQGTDLVVRFTHGGTPSGRFFVGSWAVLF